MDVSVLNLIFPLMAGLGLGCFFFFVLWLTVNHGLPSSQPALWFIGSILGRMSIAVSVLYWVGDNSLLRLCTCLIGFIIGRFVMTKYIAKLNREQVKTKEVPYAPES